MSKQTNQAGSPQAGRLMIRGCNWIGDAVMSLAAVRELRRIYPGWHMTLLVKPWVSGLFRSQGLVDEIIVLDEGGSFSRLNQARRQLQGFDRAVLFQNAFRAALASFLARVPDRVGYATDSRGFLLTRQAQNRIQERGRHQVYYYLDLLYQTGLSTVNYLEERGFKPDISLEPDSDSLDGAKNILGGLGIESGRPVVGLNPGAFYGPAKRWFSDRYAAVADRLVFEHEVQIVILGSPKEQPLAREIQQMMQAPSAIAAGRTTLSELMALISLCRLFLTNDSGPMHLAAALNVPQVAIFGSTDETATGPLSPRAVVIHKHVECSPCLLRECPIDLRCFSRISADEVYQAATQLLCL